MKSAKHSRSSGRGGSHQAASLANQKRVSVVHSWVKNESEHLRQEMLIIGSIQVFIGLFGLFMSKGLISNDTFMLNVQPAVIALFGLLMLILGTWQKKH